MDDAPTGAWTLSSGDERLALLRRLGFGELEHDSHVPFLSHLVGTARLLRAWDSRPALCDGGLFHSAYGTQYFQPAATADRDEVVALIGADAERVAWLWCTIMRDTLDPEARTVVDRHTEATLSLSAQDVSDIATLWAADTVEQIERMTPDERSFAFGLPEVLDAASPPAREAVATVQALIGRTP